jgi:hypothetical protein
MPDRKRLPGRHITAGETRLYMSPVKTTPLRRGREGGVSTATGVSD